MKVNGSNEIKKVGINENTDKTDNIEPADSLRDQFYKFESALFRDTINPFAPGILVRDFSNDESNHRIGFFGCYDAIKQWLKKKNNTKNTDEHETDENKKLERDCNLDYPYELAKQVFCEYYSFIKNNKNVGYIFDRKTNSYQAIDKDTKETWIPNINDVFTKDELIALGGNEFIRDCYKAIGKELTSEELDKYEIRKKPQIQDINSRTDNALQKAKSTKPDLYKRVDNHLSWQIFKNRNVKKLTEEEKSALEKAMKNEGFWKHLGKSELKILLFTGSAALFVGLVAAFGFGLTGEALAALILTPIGVGAFFIAPMMAPMSKKSAIVDNMIDMIDTKNQQINEQNTNFDDKLQLEENKYKEYKEKNPGFLKAEQNKEENINKEEMAENKIIPKESENNPFEMIDKQNKDDNAEKNKERQSKE